jgi:twitching motility protein PilT
MTTANGLGDVHLAELLLGARERHASDLHIASGDRPCMRIDGSLVRVGDRPLSDADVEYFLSTLLPEPALHALGSRNDLNLTQRDQRTGPLRIHAFRAGGRLRCAIRLLSRAVPSLETLELPPVLAALAGSARGLVLVSGPSGSGKSTTLAALVDRINRTAPRHIITVEDPIDYVHTPIEAFVAQTEVGFDCPDIASATRSLLRADPNVVLIGELRDAASIAAALQLAETGHLVLSSIHSADAAQTIDRMVDCFPDGMRGGTRLTLAQTLVAVISQRLVTRAAGPGRLAALEILIATDAVRALIREAKSHQLRNSIATGRGAGMHTLESHLSELVVRGRITLESARAVTSRPDDIRSIRSEA